MKKLFFVFLASFLFKVSSVFAGGSAIIPQYFIQQDASNWYLSDFFISNVTSSAVFVKIKFYRNSGSGETAPTLLTDTGNSMTSGLIAGKDMVDYSEIVAGTSASFTINPYQSIQIYLNPDGPLPYTRGYGIIEWTSSDPNVTEALVANGYSRLLYNGHFSYWAIPINGGKKF